MEDGASGAGSIQVDPSKLQGAATQMRAVQSDVHTVVANLNSAAHSATSGWQGQSVSSFNDMWSRWTTAMSHLGTAIEETAHHLDQAAEAYETTDKTAVQMK
jgi:WXG100 family type VII secretion target